MTEAAPTAGPAPRPRRPRVSRHIEAIVADPVASQAPGKPCELPFDWRKRVRPRAAMRRAELIRLARLRRSYGGAVDADKFALALAIAQSQAPAGGYRVGKAHRFVTWHGADLLALRHAVEVGADLGHFTDDELAGYLRRVAAWRAAHQDKTISAPGLGELLELTAAEREVCRITTADACDETVAQRRTRQAAAKRERDRLAAAVKRRAAGATARGECKAALKPWMVEGISRTEWYRRRKAMTLGTVSSSDAMKSNIPTRAATESSQTLDGAASQTAPVAVEPVGLQADPAPTTDAPRNDLTTGADRPDIVTVEVAKSGELKPPVASSKPSPLIVRPPGVLDFHTGATFEPGHPAGGGWRADAATARRAGLPLDPWLCWTLGALHGAAMAGRLRARLR